MIVRFGKALPQGFLPVYSVGTEREARRLLVILPTNLDGDYVAPELAKEQTIANLDAFGDRLDREHDRLVEIGWCECA